MVRKNSKKEAILQAAAEVTGRLGSDAMSLDLVAQQAGVSKGGLLYHFRTKEALVEAMLARLMDEFDASIRHEMLGEIEDVGEERPGRWHRAYINVSITPPDEIDNLLCSLLIAFAFDPKMLESVKQLSAKWIEMAASDGICPEISKIVRLASDGYWYSRLLKFEGLYGSDDDLPALRERLFALIDVNLLDPV